MLILFLFFTQCGSYCEQSRGNTQLAFGALELQLNKELDVFVTNYQKVFMDENETNGKVHCSHGSFTNCFLAMIHSQCTAYSH